MKAFTVAIRLPFAPGSVAHDGLEAVTENVHWRDRLGGAIVWRRDAVWRCQSASARQRELMKRLHLPRWDDGALSKGDATMAIVGYIIEFAVRRPRQDLRS